MSDAKKELDRILNDARNRDDMGEILQDIIPLMVDIYRDNEDRFKPDGPKRHCDLAMSVSVSMAATLFIHALHSIKPDKSEQVESFVDAWLQATSDGLIKSLEDFTHNNTGGYH